MSPPNNLRQRPRRIAFSLKTLLLFMFVAAIGSYFFKQVIMDRARFKVLETLVEVEDGYLSGSFSFRCSRFTKKGFVEWDDTVLRVENIADTKMETLKVDDEFVIHYRHRDLGPLKKENKYVLFMTRELGIRKDEIVGFVQLDGWAEVVIRGKER